MAISLDLPKPFFKNTAYFVYVFDGYINIAQRKLEKEDSIIADDESLILEATSNSTVVCFIIDKDIV